MSSSTDRDGARPTTLLPGRQLAVIAVYWFGLNAVWGAYEGFGQKQVELIVGRGSAGGPASPAALDRPEAGPVPARPRSAGSAARRTRS